MLVRVLAENIAEIGLRFLKRFRLARTRWALATVHEYRFMRGRRAFWLLFLCMIANCFVRGANGADLLEVLAKTYVSNPQLLAARAQLREKDEELSQAISGERPTFNVDTSNGYSQGSVTGGTIAQNQFYSNQAPRNSYGLTASLPLYSGGVISAKIRQANAIVRAERSSLRSIEQKVMLNAITDYADVLRDEAALKLQLDNLHMLQQRSAAAEARFSGGELNKVDVAQTEAARQQAVADIAMARRTLSTSQANFERDTDVLPDRLTTPDILIQIPKDEPEAVEMAALRNPDVVAANYEADAAEYQVDAAFGQALPQIRLEGNYRRLEGASFQGERETDRSVVLRMNMAIYSGGVLEAQTRGAEQTVSVRRFEIEQARRAAVAAAKSAWSQYLDSRDGSDAYSRQVTFDEISLKGVQYQQMAGERTILDVLNAQHTLLEARVGLVRVDRDALVAKCTLFAAIGHLTALDLNLKAPLYDPEKHLKAVEHQWFGFDASE